MGRRVLMTGGTGMIGAALTRRLLAEGDEVTLLVRPSSNRLRLLDLEASVRWAAGDIRDAASVQSAVQSARPEVVYHLASTPFNPPTISAQTHLDTIVTGTLNLLEALKSSPEIRLVTAGSAAEYGNGSGLREQQLLRPATVLGAAKASAGLLTQTYASLYRQRTVHLRIFTPYGSWERPGRLIPHTILSALDRRDIQLTSGEQQRDYFYIDDLVEALRLAAERPLAPGTVLNICSGSAVRVREIVERVLTLMGRPVRAILGALPTRSDEIRECSGDNSAARAQLEWEPRTNLEDGLQRTIAWFTEHRDLAGQLT